MLSGGQCHKIWPYVASIGTRFLPPRMEDRMVESNRISESLGGGSSDSYNASLDDKQVLSGSSHQCSRQP